MHQHQPAPPHAGSSPIGVFDSGYGGLTVLREITALLPQYDYLYLGDNARAPYGSRSFECVYQFTLQAVKYLFASGCKLVILACNTASSKALRTIQQRDLPAIDPSRRVLGVIRPTVEKLGEISHSGNVGIVGTPGTIASGSYGMEIAKLHPGFKAYGQACPLWAALVENMETDNPGTEYFVARDIRRLFDQCPDIDTMILGCTHYPIIYDLIRKHTPARVSVVSQGEIVADSLADYLRRHPEMEQRISRGAQIRYLTTEQPEKFDSMASFFMRSPVHASHIDLP